MSERLTQSNDWTETDGQDQQSASSSACTRADDEHMPDSHSVEDKVSKFGRMVVLGELVAGVVHNFGNVLMSVSAALEVVDMEISNDPRHAHFMPVIEGARDRVDNGAELIQRLLEFARCATPIIGPVDSKKVADKATALCLTHPRAKQVTISNDILQGTCAVKADENQLQEVLTNLILNALHASQQGRVTISAHECEPLGCVEISVSDEGCGIAPENIEEIFKPFFSKRGDGSIGTGLGLSCCRSQVVSMGGTLRVSSVFGKGSTFTVTLPNWEEKKNGYTHNGCRGR